MEGILSTSRPYRSLATLFVVWKGFLLAVALGAGAIGPNYDTSTSLFFERVYGRDARVPALASALTKWDALYYMHFTRAGYVYEQEWAFGATMPILTRGLVAILPFVDHSDDVAWEPLIAVVIAHISHLIALLALYRLTMIMCGNSRLAFVASALHIVSPAGVFLSAPYSESPFAALSYSGTILFALGVKHKRNWVKRAAGVVGAGVLLGLATAVRSNGLSNGLLFAVGAFGCLTAFARGPNLSRFLAMIAPGVGGLCVAAGSVIPQAIAWKRFCHDASTELHQRRPWCDSRIPGIYTFVQSEYWNVGFLRYWTVNQIPLFLLASPMLAILIASGLSVLRDPASGIKYLNVSPGPDYRMFARALAASQTLVAVLAITNYHVQVITRLSSGYPVWYWWVAGFLMDERRQGWSRAIVLFMIMYAGIQDVLFASFLPPA